MKKVLIVIDNMGMGGAQKSLVNFLQTLEASDLCKTFDIDLLVVNPNGALMSQIPPSVRLVKPLSELHWLGTKFSIDSFKHHFSWRGAAVKLIWMIRNKLNLFQQRYNMHQKLWQNGARFIPKQEGRYDVAISYIDGFTNYFVMDKVNADKKVLWVHNEYQKHGYDVEYDRAYYDASDAIITISEKCRQCILKEFPQCSEKVFVLENITSAAVIEEKSLMDANTEFSGCEKLKLLSIGRLNEEKGFDMAIEAAYRLRSSGVDFLWLIVGEGAERQKLQGMIDRFGLTDCVRLIGIRENPYVYFRQCDIIVQSSRSEGKSIVLDEAKILCKPIVATEYITVRDSINHGKSGWIVPMNSEAIAAGIEHLWRHDDLKRQISDYLKENHVSNEREMIRYLEIMM